MLTKFASLEVGEILEVKGSKNRITGAGLDKLASYEDYRTDDGYLYTRVRAISSRVNKNHDGWPAEELAKSYLTFIGKPIFVDHNNSDPSRARGVIVDAKLHVENDLQKASALDPYYSSAPENHKPPTWIELLLEVDAKAFPHLAKAIITDDIDGVSMGANVERSKCSHCENWATTPEEYCMHVMNKGAHYDKYDDFGNRTSSASYEDCYDIGFFEISYVFDPADETALDLGDKRHAIAKVAGEADAYIPNLPNDSHMDMGAKRVKEGYCVSCDGRGVIGDGSKCTRCGGDGIDKRSKITSAEDFINLHIADDKSQYRDPNKLKSQRFKDVDMSQYKNDPNSFTERKKRYLEEAAAKEETALHLQQSDMVDGRIAGVPHGYVSDRWEDGPGASHETGIPAQQQGGSNALYEKAAQGARIAELEAELRALKAKTGTLDMGGYGGSPAPNGAAGAPQFPGAGAQQAPQDQNCPKCGGQMKDGACPQCSAQGQDPGAGPMDDPTSGSITSKTARMPWNREDPNGPGDEGGTPQWAAFQLRQNEKRLKFYLDREESHGVSEKVLEDAKEAVEMAKGQLELARQKAGIPGALSLPPAAPAGPTKPVLPPAAPRPVTRDDLPPAAPRKAPEHQYFGGISKDGHVMYSVAAPDWDRDGFIMRSSDNEMLHVMFAGRDIDSLANEDYQRALGLLYAAAQSQDPRGQMTKPFFWLVNEDGGSEINITDDVEHAGNMDKPDTEDDTMDKLMNAAPFEEEGQLPNPRWLSHIATDGTVHYADNPLPQSMMTTAPEKVNSLRQETVCEVCGSDMEEGKCDVCGFEAPPEGFNNPDLEKAQAIADQAASPDAGGAAPPPGAMGDAMGPGAMGGGGGGVPAPGSTPAPSGGGAPVASTRKGHVPQAVMNVTAGKIRSNEEPIIPATKTVSDHPKTTTVVKEPTRLTQSNTKRKNMTQTLTKAEVVAQMVKRGTHGVKTASEAEALLKKSGLDVLLAANPASDPAEHHQEVDQVGGEVDNPLGDIQHIDVEKQVDIEKIPTKTWADGKGDSLGQHSPVTPDKFEGGGPIGTQAATKQADGAGAQSGIFGDEIAAEKQIDVEKPLMDEGVVGDPTKTFKSDKFHVGDPVTTENSNSLGGPIGSPLASVNRSQVVAHVLSALKVAEQMVEMGMEQPENKWELTAQLEQESPEQLQTRSEMLAKSKTAGLKKAPSKVARRMPSLVQGARTASTIDVADDNVGDSGLFR